MQLLVLGQLVLELLQLNAVEITGLDENGSSLVVLEFLRVAEVRCPP